MFLWAIKLTWHPLYNGWQIAAVATDFLSPPAWLTSLLEECCAPNKSPGKPGKVVKLRSISDARREGKSRSLASPNLRHHGASLTSLARRRKLPG
jgi:hypothetical protein